MTGAAELALALACIAGDGLEDARRLVQQGLLSRAEQVLAPMLEDEIEAARRARVLLLLGNVDYERGHYARAAVRYAQVEREAPDGAVVDTARGNRVLAERQLARSRELAALASRLRAAVGVAVILGGVVVAGLARRPPEPSAPGARPAR